MNNIKTYEDACKALGIKPRKKSIWAIFMAMFKSRTQTALERSEEAYHKLITITAALNQGWEPTWADRSEWKYYPWYAIGGSGSGFSGSICGSADSCTGVGSRLCFKNSELALYAGKQFEDLYKDFYLK